MKEKNAEQQKEPGKSPVSPSEDATLRAYHEELKTQNEELRRAQLDLARLHDRYMELFDSAPVAYLILDSGRVIREVNLTAAALFGAPRKDLIGSHLTKFMDRTAADAYYLHSREAREKGTQQSSEFEFRRADGSRFYGYMESSPYEDSVTGEGWRVALVDITTRKQAEEALLQSKEQLEEKVLERTSELREIAEDLEQSRDDLRRLASELVIAEERERKKIAVALHDEVAQSLAAIRLRIDIIGSMEKDGQILKVVEEARNLVNRSIQETRTLMSNLSSQLLYDLGLESALNGLADQIMDNHGITVLVSIEAAMKDMSIDTRVMLFQIARELLRNVVKHSRARSASISVEESDKDYRMAVSDNGIGFDILDKKLPHSEGGFGLFSIRERVSSFNGKMSIESDPSTGTEVTIVLPKQ